MTLSLKQQYLELIALTKGHLQLQSKEGDKAWKMMDKETCAFFKTARPVHSHSHSNSPSTHSPILPSSPSLNLVHSSTVSLPIEPSGTMMMKPTLPAVSIRPAAKPKKVSTPSASLEKKELEPIQKRSKSIELEPMGSLEGVDLKDIRKFFEETLPSQVVLDDIPSDEEAKKIQKPLNKIIHISEVIVLSFNEVVKHRIFLENLAIAVDSSLTHAKGRSTSDSGKPRASLISAVDLEQEIGWKGVLESKGLRLIIASHQGIYAFPELMEHYREVAKRGELYLGNVRLCLLSDLSLYFKEPKLKIDLWQALREMLVSPT